MRLSHKRKKQKKLSKWRPFFIETLIGDILTHNLNKPFPKVITSKFAYSSKIPMKRALAGWKSDINIDMSVINLKNTFPNVSDYLCAQIHLLNILCRNYGFRHLRYKVPFVQLYTGSVQDKIKTNTDEQNSHSKGNCEPFKHLPLKGYNHSHIELFPYTRNRMFEDYIENNKKTLNRTKIVQEARSSFENGEFTSIVDAVKHVMDKKEQVVLDKAAAKKGKITGFWLLSKTVNNIEKYICITPHGNGKFSDECVKSVIDTAESFSI